ncbi:hypothetical protein [Microbispora sp. CSR-4]|uniref:hypothetical protein n=1 Tax=Microbispora sp. CSR-4 TaxID=2592813 RepID=UPI001C9CA8EF|nr:hypothetical protein [Microbispora sp. CSR-4]
MSTHQPFTIAGVRVFGGRGLISGVTHVRVSDGRIAAVGNESVTRPGDEVIDGSGGTLLPGLVDAHVHLLPGCTQLAALFGVTTVVDMFSKPEIIDPERAAVAVSERGRGPSSPTYARRASARPLRAGTPRSRTRPSPT